MCDCADVGWEWVGVGPGSGGVGLCPCELRVQILCVNDQSRIMYIVLGGYLRILGAPSVQSCCILLISASYRVFGYGRHHKYRLLCVVVGPGFVSTSHTWPACPK